MKSIINQEVNTDFVEIELRRMLYSYDQFAILTSLEFYDDFVGRFKYSVTRGDKTIYYVADVAIVGNELLPDFRHARKTDASPLGTVTNIPSNVIPPIAVSKECKCTEKVINETIPPLLLNEVVTDPVSFTWQFIQSEVARLIAELASNRFSTQLLSVEENGNLFYNKIPNTDALLEQTYMAKWSTDEYGVKIDFAKAAPIVRIVDNREDSFSNYVAPIAEEAEEMKTYSEPPDWLAPIEFSKPKEKDIQNNDENLLLPTSL